MDGGPHGPAGLSMTREEHAKFLAQCKEFVLGMNRLEQSITKIDARLTKEEQRSAFKEVFEWLGTTTEVPPNSYTREWARELLGDRRDGAVRQVRRLARLVHCVAAPRSRSDRPPKFRETFH